MLRVRFRIGLMALVAAVTLAGIGCGSSSPAAPTVSADVTISMVGDRGAQSFAPNPTTIRVGQSVAWKNNDTTAHDARLLDRKDINWLKLTNGEWALSGKRSTIFLRPLAGRNWEAVVRVHADGWLIQVASGHDLALTMGIAEEKVVRKAKSDSLRMIDRSAPWRQQTATPKQLRLLAKLKIPVVEGMLAGDASDLIAAAMATQPRRIHT